MDFPVFHLDLLGNRGLIAIIAILHVLINHGLAVGMMPLVAAMEWYAHKKQDARWDRLAYKILFVCFLITTTVGALTGVGIWLSVSLVNPYSIASLIRVFFWGWFIEWLVFITEVVLIVAYTLTWKKWSTGAAKVRHIKLGFALGFFSWVTMAIIVSILGFMMDPGNWLTHRSLLVGFTNPMYLPQLAFRTPLALMEAGVIAMFLTLCFTRKDPDLRTNAIRAAGLWIMLFAPLMLLGGWWYYSKVPEAMAANLSVGLLTLQFTEWHDLLIKVIVGSLALILIVAQFAIYRPNRVPRWLPLVPLAAIIWMTGHFERVREFVRKPYVIGRYMYANGIRVDDYPLLQRDGLLAHATYSTPLTRAEIGKAPAAQIPQLQQGKDIFMIACSRCHTGNGVNSVTSQFRRMMGDGKWDPAAIQAYLANMHDAQPFMPPFPGNENDLRLLGGYMLHLQANGAPIAGGQSAGVTVNPAYTAEAMKAAKSKEIAAKETSR